MNTETLPHREIKFRYRYHDGKSWIFHVFDLAQISNGECYDIMSDNALLNNYKHVGEDQYTGLKDKNGKDVYHKDIVKGFGKLWTIEWQDEEARFWIAPSAGNSSSWKFMDELNRMEVIGNIYENNSMLSGRLQIQASPMNNTPILGHTISFRYKGNRFVKLIVTGIHAKTIDGELLNDYIGKNEEWFSGERKSFNIKEMKKIVCK